MSEPIEGEFDLGQLNDEELTEQVHDDLYNGLKTEVEEATRIFLKRGWSAERVLNDALVEGTHRPHRFPTAFRSCRRFC